MNLRRLSGRATAAAATTALAAGTVLVAAPAATAAEASNTYTCVGPVTAEFPLTVNGTFPAQVWADMAVPAGALSGTATAQIDAGTAGLLRLAGIESARSDDFTLALGEGSVPMPASGDFADDYSTWNGQAANSAFRTPAPGTYTVMMPQAFALTTVNGDGQDSVTLNCTLSAGQEAASLGEITTLKQTSTMTAPKSVKVKKGKVATIKVTVMGDAGPATGKVVAVKGKKKVSAKLKAGKAAIKVGKLPVGKHKFTVKYAGNASISGSSAKVVVKVVR